MQISKTYRLKIDKRSKIITASSLIVAALASVSLYYLYAGGYFSAWFISVVCAIIALVALSIPRKLVLTDDMLTIECLLEVIEIPIEEIVSIKRVDPSEPHQLLPLLGSFGFFGYFGYYLDLATFERVKFYATDWSSLIEIVDIYDDRHFISCSDGDELIETINNYIPSVETPQDMEL